MRRNLVVLSFAILAALLSMTATAVAQPHDCGDADGSGHVTISDAVYLISYIFSGGPAPAPLLAGDADGSEIVSISDVVYLINYIFQGGPAPDCIQFTIPATTTIVLGADAGAIQDYDTTTGTVTLDEASSSAQQIDVGDVIVGQNDSTAANGFLRRVTSKTIQGSLVILETDTASMMAAFESMDIFEIHELHPSDVVSYKLHDGVTFLRSRDAELFNVGAGLVLYDQDGDEGTTEDQIRLDGTFIFSAAIFADIEIEFFTLTKFETGIQSSQQVNLNLTANLQWEFGEETDLELAKFHLTPLLVGTVVLHPTVTVKAYISGDMTIKVATGVTYTQYVRLGAGWQDSQGFYNISYFNHNYSYSPPQFNAEFNFEEGLALQFAILAYGVAGPYVEAKAGLHFTGTLGANPCDFQLHADLKAILYGVVGLQCEVLDLDYNNEYELYSIGLGDWDFSIGESGTAIIDPNPDNLNAPWTLTGPCSYVLNGNGDLTVDSLDPGAYTITWGEVPPWTTPPADTQTLVAGTPDNISFTGTYAAATQCDVPLMSARGGMVQAAVQNSQGSFAVETEPMPGNWEGLWSEQVTASNLGACPSSSHTYLNSVPSSNPTDTSWSLTADGGFQAIYRECISGTDSSYTYASASLFENWLIDVAPCDRQYTAHLIASRTNVGDEEVFIHSFDRQFNPFAGKDSDGAVELTWTGTIPAGPVSNDNHRLFYRAGVQGGLNRGTAEVSFNFNIVIKNGSAAMKRDSGSELR